MRNQLATTLYILASELGLGPVPLESHGPSTVTVLGGWLVVRDGCIDDDCIEELHRRVNDRIAEIRGETRRIGDLFYACSRLARCA